MIKIHELRKAKGLNMSEAAKLLDMPYTTYVNYEKGSREPNSEALIQIADFFDVSIDYLLDRPGWPGCGVTQTTPPTPEPSVKSDFTPTEVDMIQKYRCLDERGQAAVMNVLNYEYSALPGEKANTFAKEA